MNVLKDDSSEAIAAELQWHIIESSDRWFQTHQRAAATTPESLCTNVTRWDGHSVAGLPARLKQPVAKAALFYLVWEFPLGDLTTTRMLDLIATVSQQQPGAIQMAHLLPGVATSTSVALQEAGISIVLRDLWTLCHVIGRIDRRHG